MRNRFAWVLLAVLGACSSGAGGGVRLSEFSIDAGAVALSGSNVQVVNEGDFAHTLLVSDADGAIVAGTEVLAPGDSTDLVLDLPPGHYEFTCRIVVETGDGRIMDHFAEGMRADVTLTDQA